MNEREYWNKLREAREKEKSVEIQQGGNYQRTQLRAYKRKFVTQPLFADETVGRHLKMSRGTDKKSRKEKRKNKRASFNQFTEELPLTQRERRHYTSYEDAINSGQYQDDYGGNKNELHYGENKDDLDYGVNKDGLDDSQYNEDPFYFQDNGGLYSFPEEGKINDCHQDDVKRADSHGDYGYVDITNVDADPYSQEDGGDDEMPEDEESCNLIEEAHLLQAESHGDSQHYGGTDDYQEKDHINASQENDNFNIIHYDDMVNVSQEDDNVRVTQEADNFTLSQGENNAHLSQEDDNVRVTQEADNVSLSQGDDNFSLSQGDDNFSLSQGDDNFSLSQGEDATNGNQEGDDLDVCHSEEGSLFYGSYETQVSEGGEADLLNHLLSCEKNPGHTEFVSPGDFNITHLPDGYRDENLVDQIRNTADLTVKVEVKMTSEERPEFWPNSQKPFPFYDRRGSEVMRSGTGIVYRARRFTDDDFKDFSIGVCNCFKCQGSATPNLVRGYVWVNTGRQVVFDDVEARHTSCRLFYDRPNSPVYLLGGWKTVKTITEEDRCCLEAVTCDIALLDTLEKMLGHMKNMNNKANDKYEFPRTEDKWVFIVSHPHGGPKQVSVGQQTNTHLVKDDLLYTKNKIMHTACTCPGSSGAYVLPLGYWGEFFYNRHLHSGVNSEGTNFSGTGWEWL